jgi:molybdopterin/thiamine biosynthesis adenylyltransferase/rhodanese-related sulfurtransferase
MAEGGAMNRYARQAILPQIGDAGQERLQQAEVLVVGAGALGVPVIQYLTGAGVGRVIVVDPDVIEVSNLHRQPLYRESQSGQHKAVAAQQAMQQLNSTIEIVPVLEWLTPANASALVSKADLVIDCADSHAVSYTLSDTCLALQKPLISASALGLEGYVGAYCAGAPSLRAIFPDPTDASATCAGAGVLGPVVGMLGCIQARMALGLLLAISPSPLGLLIRMDAGMRFSQFRFDDAPEVPGPRFIAAKDLRPGDLVVDLRTIEEAPIPATPNAVRDPDYGANGPLPDAEGRVVIACRSGLRAWRAANCLAERWRGEVALLALHQ